MNLYNDIDPDACQQLRNLIEAGLIPPGDVYECSITDLTPEICSQYTQCHFFAGIAGWPLALQIAGWPADAPVWTGSPPCQPFSVAGQQIGFDDPRHLAPAFLDLIAECRPEFVFGEQVAAAISQHWLDFIFADMEAENYTCGASVLAACSVGAPHMRSRIMFGAVGNGHIQRLEIGGGRPEYVAGEEGRQKTGSVGLSGVHGCVSDAVLPGRQIAGADYNGTPQRGESTDPATGRCWGDVEWVWCTDGSYRPLKPGIEPLAYGLSARMGSMQPELRRVVGRNRKSRLRGYGNAIVPQVAAEFITAFLDSVKIIKNNYCV